MLSVGRIANSPRQDSILSYNLSVQLHKLAVLQKLFERIISSMSSSIKEATIWRTHYLTIPRVINVDKHPAYIGATRDMKKAELLPEQCRLRQSQYMNNLIEQDHRFMKWQIRPGLGFGSFPAAYKTIQGYEVMNMIRKG